VYWKHQPIALSPAPGGPDSEGCFSGSAVVWDGVPTIIYTGVQDAAPDQVTLHDGSDKLREAQLLATAADDGLLSWKKLAAPVIAEPPSGMKVTGFRDPCPWREADGWYMAVGSGERVRGGCALLYRSQDLRKWEYLHPLAWGKPNGLKAVNPCDSGEMWECPDFFEVNGQHCLLYSTEGKVLWTTGDYDRREHRYTAKKQGLLDHGAFYAPKSFVAPDGRRILWGWIQETRPVAEYAAAGWAGVMSLPRVLTIDPTGQLNMTVAVEVNKLRGTEQRVTVKKDSPFRLSLATLRHELALQVTGNVTGARIRLLSGGQSAWEYLIDANHRTVPASGGTRLPAATNGEPLFRMFLDGSVIETITGGQEAITSRVYTLKPGETELEVSVVGPGSVDLSQWPLSTISPDRLTT
jgi:beta-fructofuranosidase